MMRSILAVLAAFAFSACAADPPQQLDDTTAMRAAVKSYPQCADEIRAFADLAQLAERYGDNWVLFQDALSDMKDQVVECAGGGSGSSDEDGVETKPIRGPAGPLAPAM